jgi:23S rRNA (uracil1939-C5)-methyltransferase
MTPDIQIRKPRRGDLLEAVLDGYDRRGRATGSSGEYRVSLLEGVPGDRWTFEVRKRRRDLLEGRALKLLEPGAARVEARCRHAAQCGGCSFQAYAYEAQLEHKRVIVGNALSAAGLESEAVVEPVLGCERPFGYRNKMDFTFGNRRWIAPEEPSGVCADFALGLHAPGLFSKVIDLEQCSILFERGEPILESARELAREHALALWDIHAHEGYLRHLVLREGTHTGQIMAVVVTHDESPELFDPYAAALLERHPEITTLVQAIHSGVASVAYGERERVVHGPGYIEEELCGTRYRISPRSFFQTNTPQAERLMEIVREEAAPAGGEVVYDLYAGAGTIALVLAPAVSEVLAFEQVPDAVADGRANADRNGIKNVRFFEGDVMAELDHVLSPASGLSRPDVCIVDPPRVGLHPKVPAKLLELGARRLVYISCNIYNGAKDVRVLEEGGYRLERVRPVDLFPHTPHVECVLTLTRG